MYKVIHPLHSSNEEGPSYIFLQKMYALHYVKHLFMLESTILISIFYKKCTNWVYQIALTFFVHFFTKNVSAMELIIQYREL